MISDCEIEPLRKIVLLYVGSHVTHEAKHFSYFYLGRQQNQVLHAHGQRCMQDFNHMLQCNKHFP